ncbi:MAG TPA: S8 family serine peptidase [Kineosporiaceae bacterium]|nr:S8 family serine peptidase [Kineosporiaceae bacterium]
MKRRPLIALAVAAAAVAGLALPSGTASAAAPAATSSCVGTPAGNLARMIVRVAPGASVDTVAAEATACGVTVIAVQRGIGTLVAQIPAGRLAAVKALPGVAVVTEDYEVKAQSLGFDPWTQNGSMTNVNVTTGANAMWKKGWTGAGVDVALIDTGVAPVSGLSDSAKVVIGPDLSFESQDPDLRYLDTYGHGTHMAGIIAGRERAKGNWWDYAWDNTNFYGMAPDARIVSLKLADRNGTVDVSQIIAAIDWVVQNRLANGMNIRVLNLSYGTHSPQSPQVDPLSWAAEVAWRSGIVVVSSAGNDGATTPGLTNPAYDPWVIAVGAVDTKGTTSMADDTVAPFSAVQGGNFNTRGIDLVAPGVGIVSLGVPGSYVYQTYPAARIGNGFIRGSGTSQASAVVSGAAALLISQRPYLLPNQVKALLMNGATKLANDPVTKQGSGELNLVTSSALGLPTNLQMPMIGNGTGGLESARGGIHVTMNGSALADERDIMGDSFVGPIMAARTGGISAWGPDGSFNGAVWIGSGFAADTSTVAGKTWGGKSWTGKSWTGKSWTGELWSGKSWTNSVWTASGWSSANWTAPVNSDAWAGALWTTQSWG